MVLLICQTTKHTAYSHEFNHISMQQMYEMLVQSLGWGIPWKRTWQPTPVFLPGESHEQRSLVS